LLFRHKCTDSELFHGSKYLAWRVFVRQRSKGTQMRTREAQSDI